MSFSLEPDEHGFPIIPPGKMARLANMCYLWQKWWHDRRELRVAEWGEYSDWGAMIYEAAGPTLATYFNVSPDGDPDGPWYVVVTRGSVSNPKAILDLGNFVTTYGIDIAEDRIADRTNWEEDYPEKFIVSARWFAWCYYQAALGECVYHFFNYTPRPRGG